MSCPQAQVEMLTPEPSIILLQILDTGVNFGEIVWVMSKESPNPKELLCRRSLLPFGFSCYWPTGLKEIFVNSIHLTCLLKKALLDASIPG